MVRAVTRRRLLSAGAGVAGAVALAACGETQIVTKEVPVETIVIKEVPVEKVVVQTEIKEVPVEKIVVQEKVVEVEKVVEKVVEVEVEVQAPPQVQSMTFTFGTDHTSGPRGKAMQWALDKFASVSPHLNVKFVAAPTGTDEVYGVQFASGGQPEVALKFF